MKISYKWLKEYIDIKITPEELEQRLTFAGIEVETIETLGEELKSIKVAKIIEKESHPNAEKLSICTVFDGEKNLQVVCGASNCAKGQCIAFAPVGSIVGNFKIKKAKLRGVQSFGMICSEKELGLSENHDGIMVLREGAEIGVNLSEYLDYQDTIFDVEITPNRPDLLGIIGVARDLSALLGLELKLPETSLPISSINISESLQLKNENSEKCPRYIARLIKDVKVEESPEWLKKRILSVGLRPINNIVDITNFVMMEYGHPLHAFDYSKLEERQIIVRNAKKDEAITALDNQKYQLTEDDLVIADSTKPIALAGIIGCQNSQITNETVDIVIEAANFLYSSVRKTSGRLKISTDSCYRFERGMSDINAKNVSDRACSLIIEIAGGSLANGTLDSFENIKEPVQVSLRPDKVRSFLSIDINDAKIIEYLENLGLKLIEQSSQKISFTIPHYRNDLTREIDLIEEIIRLHGYNNVASKLKTQNIMNKELFQLRRSVQDFLINEGFYGTVNWPFADPESLNKLKISENDLRRNFISIKNPIGKSFSVMQTTLLPNLFKNALYNINHNQKDLKLFELTKTFKKSDNISKREDFTVSGLITGKFLEIYWNSNQQEVDFFDLKGIIEDLFDYLKIEKFTMVKSKENFYQLQLGVDVLINKKIVGSFGKVDPKIAENFEIERPIYTFELNLSEINKINCFKKHTFIEIPKFPPVLRDLSILVSKDYSFEQLENCIYSTNPKVIRKIVLFDEFTGKMIDKGFKSLSFNIMFGSDTKTLTDDYIKKLFDKIVKNLKQKYNIRLR